MNSEYLLLKFSILYSTFCLLLIGGAWSDVKPPEGSDDRKGELPPSPQDIVVKLVRGKATPIELKAITNTTRDVVFLIRSAPQAGEIGELRRLPRKAEYNRAEVVYLAPEGGTESSDSFQYAAKLSGGVVSAPATVRIEIENPKAVLEFRKGYAFGSVQIGASGIARIPIENTGTGPYRQELSAPAPWELLLESGTLEIPDGEARELIVRYTPTEAIDSRLELELEGAPDGEVLILTGEGVAPFIGSPTVLSLQYDPEHGDRRGQVSLRNTLGHALTVDVKTQGNLKFESERITMPPLGAADALLTLDGKSPYQGEVRFRSFTGYEQVVQVQAEMMPARVSVLGAPASEGVTVERTMIGELGLAQFEVQNVGGDGGTVIVEVPPPFVVDESNRSFRFLPGEERSITVGLQSEVSGDFSGHLKLYCGDQIVSLLILGSVVTVKELPEMTGEPSVGEEASALNTGASVPSDPRASRSPTAEERRLSSLLFHYGIGAQREFNRAVPQIDSLRVSKRTQTSLTMEWSEPVGGPYDYEIDMERLLRIPGYEGLMKFWIPFREVKIRKERGKVFATFENLKPAANYRWRVATHSEGMGYSLPTEPFEVGTAFPTKWPWKWILIGLGAVIAGGFWIQQRRTAFAGL